LQALQVLLRRKHGRQIESAVPLHRQLLPQPDGRGFQ